MIDESRPYPEYKESGLPWCPRIPSHWKIKRAKNVFRCIDVRSKTGTEERLTVSAKHGVVPRSSLKVTMFEAKSYIGHKLCWPEDLVINSLWAWSQGLGVARHHGLISSAYGVYRLNTNLAGYSYFIHYLVRSKAFHWELHTRSKGVWISRLQLTDDAFMRAPLLFPPKNEADAITRFIRDMDHRVNTFIRNRRRLIEVLNEQKQAIINRAVTCGLDPNAPLKPTGIDWLGDIPEHWEAKPLRQLGRFTKGSGGSREDDVAEGLPCIRYGHLYMYFNFTVSAVRTYVSESRACDYARIKYGDLLFTASGEDMSEIGKSVVNLIDEEVCCGGDVIILRPQIDAYPPFLGYASDAWHARCQKARLGRGTTIKHIYGDQLKKVCIALPPKAEQVEIAEHIRQATSEATTLIDRAKREIDLIREYRTRLISDVVTGKVDVRHLAPPPGSEELEDLAEAIEPLEEDITENMIDDEEPNYESGR